MPGPGNKRKSKASTNARARGDTKQTESDIQATSTHADSLQCLTLEEDEITRCGQLATEGHPKPERCKVHHGQYRVLYKKYKDASKVVDDVKAGSELPAKEQISRYTDWHVALKKSRWVRKYLEAIRVEKAGRHIHQRRFFLKVDDGHRRRLKLLEREMIKAVDALDALQKRAYELYQQNGSLPAMNNFEALSTAEVDLEKQSKQTTEEVLESVHNIDAFRDSTLPTPRKKALAPVPPTTPGPAVGDEDLIDMSLRVQKERMIQILKPFVDFESHIEAFGELDDAHPETESSRALREKRFFIFQQFSRRIIFHEPSLFMKSLERVSFKDLILSDDFSMEDLARFLKLFSDPLGFTLKWFKDAVLDALAISRHGTAANVGSVESRFPLLGGWVFNRSHTVSMPNEAWWLLLQMLQPPGNVENCFVRLCNNFDDLIGFLSFEALGLVPSPNFCQGDLPYGFDDPSLSRNHLSLSGIIVADMISSPNVHGPIPTNRRATKQGCMVWAEFETRAYMFGAMRNEPDAFVEAFLRELRARPDLFQVIIRSETAPGREVEVFGSGPLNNEALPAMRWRTFEAPPSPSSPFTPVSKSSKWDVFQSAMDVLYGAGIQMPFGEKKHMVFGGQKDLLGYLTMLARDIKGWFFSFKTFPVTYFAILDTVPYRDRSVLARNVSWAALRARGYAEGEYTLRKYAMASDKLFEECAHERFGWMPKDMEWGIAKMEDRMNARGSCVRDEASSPSIIYP
ncbi:hypothetical protein J3R82DRAFT_6372 [Butyriboletus roseoflavus]|nr:hypothetical protein J3R82DRAFT_6372 [Butyriboletus roseoflavus]